VGLAAAGPQMGVGDEDGAVAAVTDRVQDKDGWVSGGDRVEAFQRILEPRNFGHLVSPALLVRGIADSRESFVAPLRQCDESAAFPNFCHWCAAHLPRQAADWPNFGQS